jgi:acyl carrier protein
MWPDCGGTPLADVAKRGEGFTQLRENMYLEGVREIVAQHGRLGIPVGDLPDDGDLYSAGLTSLATVGLMLALEDAFDIEFPDSMLSRKTFASIASLADAVETLTVGRASVG